MAKILISKPKKVFIKELNKQVQVTKGRKYYISTPTKDYHCSEGVVSKKELQKKDGSIVKTNKGKTFSLLPASFPDHYTQIKRVAQIIPKKDLGFIIIETGVNKNSTVVDAGAGSGGLVCFLAHICKSVVTYDIHDHHLSIVKANKKLLNLSNLTIKKKDIRKGFDEKNVDLVTLDLPDPWDALNAAARALKPGGFVVSYSPSIPQTMDFVNAIPDSFIHLRTVEIFEREWEVEGRKVHPKSVSIGHSGFLTLLRKIT